MEVTVMKKRLLTWVLCFTMVCSLVPATVLAVSWRVEMISNAMPIKANEPFSFSSATDAEVYHYFSINTTKPGQFISLNATLNNSNSGIAAIICDSSGTILNSDGYDSAVSLRSTASSVGTYYIAIETYESVSATLAVSLFDNDEYEFNNTQATATPLRFGDSADIKLWGDDDDWFCVETTEDAQDVRVDISGFAYNNQGSVYMAFDGMYLEQGGVRSNGSFYFHASKTGKHYITLRANDRVSSYSNDKPLSLTVTATLLEGDGNESNDTQETATALALGTDKTFSLGGRGDEDWFRFDVVPEAEGNDLYTLRFLDLNPDYSDELRYEVYAPSGEKVVAETEVNIAHSVIFSCTEQGAYYVRVYTIYRNAFNLSVIPITRSALRIRVSQGGSDPYESNDSWLTAAPLQVGQLTQHVLSSTADEDWFWFTAPEADMGFQFETSRSTRAYLYRASDLAESGTSAKAISNYSACKLDEAGVYYIRLTTYSSYATEELRSFTVTLTAPGSEENNDTWDRATPLFESVPQRFDLFGYNDTDWFKITVPEGIQTLFLQIKVVSTERYCPYFYLYSEKDILAAGLNTNPVYEDYFTHYTGQPYSVSVASGTYYLKVINDGNTLITDNTVSFSLSEKRTSSSRNDPLILAENEWSAPLAGDAYITLGELQIGDVVHLDWNSECHSTNVQLLNVSTSSKTFSDTAHSCFRIPETGIYIFYIPSIKGMDSNGEPHRSRIRYSVCHPDDAPATALEGPDEITLYVGQKQYVDLQLTPTDGYSNYSYYYYSYNTDSSVASYNNTTGYVTATAEGSTQITFNCETNNTTLSKTVTVKVLAAPEATGLAISGAPESLPLGGKAYLTAGLTPEGAAADVSWSSSDSSVLYVFPGGKVVAVGEGSATITATAGELSDEVTIAVPPAAPTVNELRSLTLDAYSLTLYMGEESQKLTAATQPADIDTRITWTTSNAGVATVDQSGNVSAIAPGVSIISASAGDHSVSCVVTVQAARVRVTGISFAAEELSIPLGGESLLNPTITPYNATTKSLTWVSDDPRIASVSRTGTVNALAVGETTIRATTLDGGKVAEITIIVTTRPQLGDVNGDGYIDAGDAMLCMRSAVELVELTAQQFAAADVNGDGSVDAGDAVKILRYNAGLIETLQ